MRPSMTKASLDPNARPTVTSVTKDEKSPSLACAAARLALHAMIARLTGLLRSAGAARVVVAARPTACVRRQLSSKGGPKSGDESQPLTKLWHTLRGLWKLRSATPNLAAKLEARKQQLAQEHERHKFATDKLVKTLTDKFGNHVDGMMEKEHERNAMRKKIIMEKLNAVQLDPAKIQERVTGSMLDKWDAVLSQGGAAAAAKAAAPPGGSGKGGSGGGGASTGGGAAAGSGAADSDRGGAGGAPR